MIVLWDEQPNSTTLNSGELLNKFSNLLMQYQKKTSPASDETFFAVLATGADKELLRILLNMPEKTRSKLLALVRDAVRDESLKHNGSPARPNPKRLLRTSPHKKLPIVQPAETIRALEEWDF